MHHHLVGFMFSHVCRQMEEKHLVTQEDTVGFSWRSYRLGCLLMSICGCSHFKLSPRGPWTLIQDISGEKAPESGLGHWLWIERRGKFIPDLRGGVNNSLWRLLEIATYLLHSEEKPEAMCAQGSHSCPMYGRAVEISKAGHGATIEKPLKETCEHPAFIKQVYP